MERKYTNLMATVHADAPEILIEIENILVRKILSKFVSMQIFFLLLQDEDFTFSVIGQPAWKREQFKELYPFFRQQVSCIIPF